MSSAAKTNPTDLHVKIFECEGAKPIEFPTDEKNRLSISSVKMIFPGAIGLRYLSSNGTIRIVRTDPNCTYFFPPESGFQNKDFYLILSNNDLSIGNSSTETRSEEQCLLIQRLSAFVYIVDEMIACATAVGPDILVTCYHCIAPKILSGANEEKNHREAIIELTNASTGRKIEAKIMIYSIEKNVAFLRALNNVKLMENDEMAFNEAYMGQPYYIFGTPVSEDGSPLQVLSGIISAIFTRTFAAYNLHGHGGARIGASGGPAFARQLFRGKIHLLGIVVAGPTINSDTKLGASVSSNYVKLISPSILVNIYENYTRNVFKL